MRNREPVAAAPPPRQWPAPPINGAVKELR